jgi:uncharacterized oligopeptide transporter (OPT) family protein
MTEPPADRELTVRAVAWGLVLGVLLAAVNVYAGLKIAYVDFGSSTLVLLTFAAFGVGARRFTAREANVAQVVGTSAGAMAITAGVTGSIPALAMSGRETSPLAIFVWGGALAVLGTFAAIPFRATMIEVKQLPFPSARAAGELIRSLFVEGRGSRRNVWVLAGAGLAAALVTTAREGLHLIGAGWMLPISIAGISAAHLSIGITASPLLVGVGLLAGARVGASMLLGAVIAWIAIAPRLGVAEPDYTTLVGWTTWPGAALMIAGSLTGLALDARDLLRATQLRSGAAGPWVWIAMLGAAAVVIAAGRYGFGVHPLLGALAVVLAVLFSVAAMQATGETDTTPAGSLGSVAQIAIGATGPGDISPPLFAGGVANGVAAQAATMMNGWKAGSLVGATPARLLGAQLAGIAAGTAASLGAFWLIRKAYVLGGEAMPVPGALSWRAMAEAVAKGTEHMPAGAPVAALVAGIAAIALTLLQRVKRVQRFLPSPIAMGLAFVMPFSLAATLALSAFGFGIAAARAPAWFERNGPSLGSGLVVGEAVPGLVIALILLLGAS